MKAFEEHHNDAAQVEDYCRAALALVDELDPPADLRPLVFAKAVDLLSAKTLQCVPGNGISVPSPVLGGLRG
jgi:hypothetical protein